MKKTLVDFLKAKFLIHLCILQVKGEVRVSFFVSEEDLKHFQGFPSAFEGGFRWEDSSSPSSKKKDDSIN